MGQSKRRKQQLGDLYGTAKGSNRPKNQTWKGLELLGLVVLDAQAMADSDNRPRAVWMNGPKPDNTIELQLRWEAPNPEPPDLMWVPPTPCGAALAYRHPVWVHRSTLSGKWAVALYLSTGPHVMDVFNDLKNALASAQSAQLVFGSVPATADTDESLYFKLVKAYGEMDADKGIDSDDGFAVAEPGSDGFRVLRGIGDISADRLGLAVDAMRQAGFHVRLPDTNGQT